MKTRTICIGAHRHQLCLKHDCLSFATKVPQANMVWSQKPRHATHSLFTTAYLCDALCGFCLSHTESAYLVVECRAEAAVRAGKLDRQHCMCDGPHYHPHVGVGVTLGVLDLSTFTQTDDFSSHMDARAPSLQGVFKILAKKRFQRSRSEKQSKYVLKKSSLTHLHI